jgi:fido (protein-threonine AMPylation protein)
MSGQFLLGQGQGSLLRNTESLNSHVVYSLPNSFAFFWCQNSHSWQHYRCLMPMSTHLWSKIRAFGLSPAITSLDHYEERVTIGLIRARLQAQAQPVINPNSTTMARYHRFIFEEVYPWAGQFRGIGELSVVDGTVGAEWDRIDRELEMLHWQTGQLLSQVRSDRDAIRALAFAHVRFERVHPFRDGNGRVGRVLLDGQLNAALGFKQRPLLDRERYLAALHAAQRGGLAQVVDLIAEREGMGQEERHFEAPYRLAPFMVDGVERSLEQDLARSRSAV